MIQNNDLIKQASDTIKLLCAQLNEVESRRKMEDDSIAITGMSCQVPGASSIPVFWNRLINKFDGVSCYPDKRWSMLPNHIQEATENISSIHGGYLSDIDLFEPGLFNISSREATCMDPQQRLILMNAFQAIEDAGIKNLSNFRRTGVFMSLFPSEYIHLNSGYEMRDALFFSTGNATSLASNRLSYIYNFSGPSLVIDTACSSSLYGIEIAIRYLKSGDIDYAIVGGVSLNLLPFVTKLLQDAKMLSPDGKCHTFDTSANGYVQGEGVGVIVLERYSNVKKHSRRGYALIKGAAVNQDGRTNGLTAPNGIAQEDVIKAACNKANISPNQIQYIETHGTGTFLGDPVEVEAIGNVISDDRSSDNKNCVLGCLKTNIGHLEPAAAILSTIKVALCIVAGKIPGNNHLNEINPLLQIDKYPIMLPQNTVEWKDKEKFAGVSSFGFGGSNGHIVMSSLKDDFSYNEDDIHQYSPTSKIGKSYWYIKKKRIKSQSLINKADLSFFLPYKFMDSPLELFRAVTSFNSDQLLGGQDTGNFHIGFYIESIYKIMSAKFTFHRCLIRDITFKKIFILPEHTNIDLQVIVKTKEKTPKASQSKDMQGAYRCDFYARMDQSSKWTNTAQADVRLYAYGTEAPKAMSKRTIDAHNHLTEDEFYTKFGAIGFPVNGFIRAIQFISFNEDEGVADLLLYEDLKMYSLGAHPGFLDAVLQPALVIAGVDKLYMTTKMTNITIHSTTVKNDHYYLYTKVVRNSKDKLNVRWEICSKNKHLPIIQCEQTVLKSIGSKGDVLWAQELFREKSGNIKSVLDFVVDLLDAKIEEIPLDSPLIDLGMNSIMIMSLSGYLEQEGISVNGSLFEITLVELLEVEQRKARSLRQVNDDNNWFRWYRKTSANQRCLICVPYGFGSASLYKDWPQWIDSSCDICAIQLPGREDRLDELSYDDINTLLNDLSPLVRSVTLTYKQCYFYGHSMGALVSYCLCRDLVEQGHIKGLYVGGFSAPVRKNNPLVERIDKQMRQFGLENGVPKDASQFPDEALKLMILNQDVSHQIENLKERNISLDSIKNLCLKDFWLVKSYDITENQVLTIPITVWHGINDDYVSLESSEAWELLTTCKDKFQLHCVESHHNFIDNKAEEVATRLNKSLICHNIQ